MNPNHHIDQYLDYYCKLESPGYALLLTGKWGCGKSHFISQFREVNTDLKFIYVSLYGMQNTSQIDDTFFEQLHPWLAHKGMDIAGKVLTSSFRAAAFGFNLYGDDKSDGNIQMQIPGDTGFFDLLKDTKGHILVFDDLERCCMPMAYVLGYINSFVEHNDRNVILVADEARIPKKKKKAYTRIKEKLIGQSLEVQVDAESALESFLPLVKNDSCRSFLESNHSFVMDEFKVSEYNNLRTLKKIIQDFEHIYSMLPDKAQAKEVLIRHILGILMMLSFEIRSGKLDLDEVGKLLEPSWLAWAGEENEDGRLSKLARKYGHLLGNYPVPDQTLWQNYLKTGLFDQAALEKSVMESAYLRDENTPDWIQLWHGLDLDDNEYEAVCKSVEKSLTERAYKKSPVIKHVFGLFLWMSQKGIYSDKSEEEIYSEFCGYVETLIADGTIEFVEHERSAWDDSYDGLGYFSIGETRFKDFCLFITKKYDCHIKASYPEQAKKLLSEMKQDAQLFYHRLCLSESSEMKYHNIPILTYLLPEDFFHALIEVPADQLRIVGNTFKERYRHDSRSLIAELKWLISVKNLLMEESHRRAGKISGHAFQSIVKYGVSPAIEILEQQNEEGA